MLEGVDVVAPLFGDDVAAFAVVGVLGHEVLVLEDFEVALDLEEAEIGFVHEIGFDHRVKIAQVKHFVDDFMLATVTKSNKGQNRKLS